MARGLDGDSTGFMKSPVPEWSEAKFKAFIISALRGAFRRFPPKQQCINQAYTRTKINTKTKRKARHYRCAKCKGEFPRSEVQADHKKPIIDPKKGFEGFETWIERGFVPLSGFQCLCKGCHSKKTALERKKRKC